MIRQARLVTRQTRPAVILFTQRMVELTPRQMETMERLFEAGFRPIAIPPYEKALCIHRGECAAILSPAPDDGLQLLAPPTYLVAGNLSVRVKRAAGDVFVWKKSELPATTERLQELERFRGELVRILQSPTGGTPR